MSPFRNLRAIKLAAVKLVSVGLTRVRLASVRLAANPAPSRLRGLASAATVSVFALFTTLAFLQCSAPEPNPMRPPTDDPLAQSAVASKAAPRDALAAWNVVYEVLQHPRCLNCHPAGDRPLQGDESLPHQQNVQRGPDGHGLFGMRCEACHMEKNLEGDHLPPGAPKWHLPPKDMPLVFEGRSSGDLCRQLKDPKRNGGKTMAEIFDHMAKDELVLWGWNPGNGRAPVSVPHDELVKALRTWIDNGCGCPGD